MIRLILAITVLMLGLGFTMLGQERYVKPVDEATLDPSFAAFRTKLIAAAERRDTAYIISILDPKIGLSFGGDQGVRDFKRILKPQDRNSWFWPEFLRVIKNGGSFSRDAGKRTDVFYAPYTFGSFPDDLDSYELAVIFGSDVNLRKEPRATSPSVAKLSYNVVRIQTEIVPKSGKSEYPGWHLIRTLGGLEGYVKREFVRSPIDYRAAFEKKRGRWVMTAFISGD